MKTEELRALSESELAALEVKLGRSLLELRFQQTIGQLADTSQLKKTRRELARVKTEMSRRRRVAA